MWVGVHDVCVCVLLCDVCLYLCVCVAVCNYVWCVYNCGDIGFGLIGGNQICQTTWWYERMVMNGVCG